MIFKTRSGSIYELDEVNKRARKLSNNKTDSVRLLREWRNYIDAFVILGKRALICWTSETPLLDENELGIGVPMTETSPVVEIVE